MHNCSNRMIKESYQQWAQNPSLKPIPLDMPLTLSEATESDTARIASIHMSAFLANDMLHAQFSTPTIRNRLQICIAQKAVADIWDPKTAVLVVRDRNLNDEIISFAKWHLPVLDGERYEEPAWVWPEGTEIGVLDEWTERIEEARRRVVGEGACYRKFSGNSFITVYFLC